MVAAPNGWITINVLYARPGGAAEIVCVDDCQASFRMLLDNCKLMDFTAFAAKGRLYHLICDDAAEAKRLPENRKIVAGRYKGHVVRGPIVVTRIQGDWDRSVFYEDLPFIGEFLELREGDRT